MATSENEFGRSFRSRRTVLGMNLSEFCRTNGFDKGNISRLERGLTKPPRIARLAPDLCGSLQLHPKSEDGRRSCDTRQSQEPMWGLFSLGGSMIRGSRREISKNGPLLATLKRDCPN